MSHDSPPTPCGIYARGETEDYTVFINDTSITPPPIPTGLNVYNIANTSAAFSWTPDNNAASYHLRYKKTTETLWTLASVNTPSVTVPAGLSANTAYNYACESVGSSGPSGFSATQTFTTIAAPLPIDSVEITASRQGANVLVNWSTQSEQNSAWFDVERSYNGIDFIKIGQVQASGFSSNTKFYQFTDVNASRAMIFYRLKMVDLNSSYKISAVVKIAKSRGNDQGFLLYPNPAIYNVNVALNESTKEDLQLKVTNQLGQVVKSTRLSKGTYLIKLDISGLPKGIYTVILTGSETVLVKKLIVR
jgi:Secretion system C-terminal sorting domain